MVRGARLPLIPESRKRIAGLSASRMHEANLEASEPCLQDFKAIGEPVRPMDQDQPPLRLEKSRAGLQPDLEPAGRQGMGRRPALVRRDPRLPLLQEGRVGEDEIGALGPQPCRSREALSSTSATATRPSHPLSRQFRRQSSARVGIALDEDEARVLRPAATIKTDGAGRRARHPSPRRRAALGRGGEQHRIGAGAVALGGLAQATRARRAADPR